MSLDDSPRCTRAVAAALLVCAFDLSGGCMRFGYDELSASNIQAGDGGSKPPNDAGSAVADAQVYGGQAVSDAALDAGGMAGSEDAAAAGGAGGVAGVGGSIAGAGGSTAGAGGSTSGAGAGAGAAGTMGGVGGGAAAGGGPVVGTCADQPLTARTIDIVDAQVIDGPHQDFPLLVSLTASWLRTLDQGGSVADAQGADLRFALDAQGASLLDVELEQYDSVNGSLVAWVRVPALDAATVLYLLYGECAALLPRPMGSVWAGYSAVWHLEDNAEATGQSSDAVEEGSVASGPGQIVGGRLFDGSAGAFNAGSSTAVDDVFQGGGAVSAWIFPSASTSGVAGRIASKVPQRSLNLDGWALMLDPVPSGSLLFRHDFSATPGYWSTPVGSLALGGWHLVAVQYTNTSTTEVPEFYIDGQRMSPGSTMQTPSGSADSDAPANVYIGNLGDGSRPFTGTIDELRLSRTRRPAGWFATEYNNQHDPSGFFVVTPP